MENMLFDSRARADASYPRHDEDMFAFLDRVDDVCFARVRDLMNTWFNELPSAKAPSVLSNASSGKDAQIEAALWELFLHAAFLRTPFEVTTDVVTGSRGENVDFVLAVPERNVPAFSVEAVAVGDPPRARARSKRLKAAWDVLNQETASGFFLWVVQVEREGRRTPPGTKIRKAVLPWLASLDRTTVLSEATTDRPPYPECTIDVDDWSFVVRAIPISDEAASTPEKGRRLVGAEPIETAAEGPGQAIRRGLRRKSAAKYDRLGLPYVVALSDLHRFSGDDDLMTQLYGDEAVEVTFRGDEIISTNSIRKHNGHWSSANTRTSAVLYARQLLPWSVPHVIPELWLNPWAARPLPRELPWAATISVNDDGSLARTPPSMTLAELFELPDGWPGRPFNSN
jgi:hypothetical protein